MKKTKIILFNGPPQSGKDTAVNHLVKMGVIEQNLKFAKEVKERTHALYGLDIKKYPHDYFEDVKDDKLDVFLGLSPREAYIKVSQIYMKPVHGIDVWATMLSSTIEEKYNGCLLGISDLGFPCEIEKLISNFGTENIMLFRIFREGKNFENDSREYIKVKEEDGSPIYKGLVYNDVVNIDVKKFLNVVHGYALTFLNDNPHINISINA